MATSRPPDDLTAPGGSDRDEQRQSSPLHENEELDTDVSAGVSPHPRGREKKKVGFASGALVQETHEDAVVAGPSQPYTYITPTEQYESGEQDYFGLASSPNNSPEDVDDANRVKRESFNRDTLAAELAQILRPENLSGPVHPSKPRPVLRKPTPLPPHPETEPHQSEIEAKNRADRLAYHIGTSSVPVSRRGSADVSESGMKSPLDGDALIEKSDAGRSQDFSPQDPEDAQGLRNRKTPQQEADRLVRTHTRRKSPLVHTILPPSSGTATPVEHDLEYVPRPEKYKGGILGTLLKLYSSEDKNGSTATLVGDSLQSTPTQTPNRTPLSTPPASRSSTPRPDGRRRRDNRQSTNTLAGLMESSFMIAAPGTNRDINEAVSEKLRAEKDRRKMEKTKSKKKAEEYKIKFHIAEIINRHRYLIKLCNALMIYGAPTHRLEAYMRMSARVLGIEGQFLYLPGIMIVSFDDSQTHTTEVKIVRAGQGLDFGRLRDVHEVYKEVVHDRIGVDEAMTRLDDVINRKEKFPTWFRILLSGVASACVAPFGFEGRYIDLPICFVLGCIVGYLQLHLAPSNELYANVFEITAAVITSCLARAFGSIANGSLFCFSALAQASIALILPGYMVLCASLELQSHQMISGSVRMVYALIYTLFLGYGITIGSVIYGYMDENASSAVHCSVGDEWYLKRPGQDYYVLFVLPFTLCLCAINQAKWKQTPVQVAISVAGYLVNNYSSRFFLGNSIVSSSLGALTIGVLANVYSRLGKYTQNWWYDLWENHLERQWDRLRGRRARGTPDTLKSSYYVTSPTDSDEPDPKKGVASEEDPELGGQGGGAIKRHARKIGYGLAAAAMLPAIFVQVPGGLAVSGSLLSGVATANQVVRNETILTNGTIINGTYTTTTVGSTGATDLNSTAFNVLFSVIQVAINISVGLSLSALLVYPFGKRRSGLFAL